MNQELRQKVWDILFENAVNALAEQPKSMSISRLLCMASHYRYNIERVLAKWFDEDIDDDILYKFGLVRFSGANWGRFNVKIDDDIEEPISFYPFVWFNDSIYNKTNTSMYSKYKDYEMQLKLISGTKCKSNVSTSVMKNVSHKVSPSTRTIWWSPNCADKNGNKYEKIELSTFYYENSDMLINVLKKDLTKNVGKYRAIYHTPVQSHSKIIEYLEDNMFMIHNGNMTEKVNYVKLTYWLLSHATLFERGSASITEMICNTLWRWIGMDGMITCHSKKIGNIEAILSTGPEMWDIIFGLTFRTLQLKQHKSKLFDVYKWMECKFIRKNPRLICSINDIEKCLINSPDTHTIFGDSYDSPIWENEEDF